MIDGEVHRGMLITFEHCNQTTPCPLYWLLNIQMDLKLLKLIYM